MSSPFLAFKQAFARERLTVSNTTKTLTAATYTDAANAGTSTNQKAYGAKITIETADIRYTEEGTAPSDTSGSEVGSVAASGSTIYLEGYNAIAKFKACRKGTTDAVIEVVYYR